MAAHPVVASVPLPSRRRARLRRSMLLLLVLCNLLAAGAALVGANEVPTNPGSLVTFSSPVAVAAAENADAVELVLRGLERGDPHRRHGPAGRARRPGCRLVPALPRTGGRPCRAQALRGRSPSGIARDASGWSTRWWEASRRWSPCGCACLAIPSRARRRHGVRSTRFGSSTVEIAERRNGLEGATLAEPLLGARLDALPPAVTGVVLARLTFAVGSGTDGLLSAGPTLLVVESGALWIRIAYDGQILRAGGQVETGDDAYATSGGVIETVLRQGDGAIVPAGVRHSLRQVGTEPGAVLGATLAIRRQRGRPLRAATSRGGGVRILRQ